MESQSRQLSSAFQADQGSVSRGLRPQMKVLLDARKLGDGGIGTYIENLIFGLLDCGVPLSVIAKRSALADRGLLDQVGILEDSSAGYSLSEMFLLARRINRHQFDLYHSPHYTLPFGLRIPSVVTVHDTIHISHPEHFYYPMIARSMIRSALRRAQRIITVSEASRRDLLALLPTASNLAQKISVIPNSVDPIFYPGPVAARRNPYFLAVFSNCKPHKGLVELLAAFENLVRTHSNLPRGLKLVLVGPGTSGLVHLREDVVSLGAVSLERLADLYRGALALVVSSKSEGFCLPVLEAHASGTPVVTTPVPAVLELVKEADTVCSGFSDNDIATGMRKALERYLVEAPPAQGVKLQNEAYSRVTVAKRVLELYQSALSK